MCDRGMRLLTDCFKRQGDFFPLFQAIYNEIVCYLSPAFAHNLQVSENAL